MTCDRQMQNDVTSVPNCRDSGDTGEMAIIAVELALACFKTRVDLIDGVNATFAANQTVCPVTAFQGLKRVLNFHRIIPSMLGSNLGKPTKNSAPQAARAKSVAGLRPIPQMSRRL